MRKADESRFIWANMRRTEVLPIFSHREISDLLISWRNSFRISAGLTADGCDGVSADAGTDWPVNRRKVTLLRKHINPFGRYHFDLDRMKNNGSEISRKFLN